ncbi:MAG: hypothetical protein KFF73_13135 [Cyclobacteriaceae bacterium]|nr:hypothetical protein [Cyclobacteriaceae bacterium]
MNKIAALFLFAVIMFSGCGKEDVQYADPISGKWKARWELMNPVMHDFFQDEQRIMDGEVFFYMNQAKIRAFGFEGCAFKTDTSENILHFKKENGMLKLIDSDDDVIFSYLIANESDDLLKLLLMEDISLTLTR